MWFHLCAARSPSLLPAASRAPEIGARTVGQWVPARVVASGPGPAGRCALPRHSLLSSIPLGGGSGRTGHGAPPWLLTGLSRGARHLIARLSLPSVGLDSHVQEQASQGPGAQQHSAGMRCSWGSRGQMQPPLWNEHMAQAGSTVPTVALPRLSPPTAPADLAPQWEEQVLGRPAGGGSQPLRSLSPSGL